MTSLGHLERF
jgi:hypothetical protein